MPEASVALHHDLQSPRTPRPVPQMGSPLWPQASAVCPLPLVSLTVCRSHWLRYLAWVTSSSAKPEYRHAPEGCGDTASIGVPNPE